MNTTPFGNNLHAHTCYCCVNVSIVRHCACDEKPVSKTCTHETQSLTRQLQARTCSHTHAPTSSDLHCMDTIRQRTRQDSLYTRHTFRPTGTLIDHANRTRNRPGDCTHKSQPFNTSPYAVLQHAPSPEGLIRAKYNTHLNTDHIRKQYHL